MKKCVGLWCSLFFLLSLLGCGKSKLFYRISGDLSSEILLQALKESSPEAPASLKILNPNCQAIKTEVVLATTLTEFSQQARAEDIQQTYLIMGRNLSVTRSGKLIPITLNYLIPLRVYLTLSDGLGQHQMSSDVAVELFYYFGIPILTGNLEALLQSDRFLSLEIENNNYAHNRIAIDKNFMQYFKESSPETANEIKDFLDITPSELNQWLTDLGFISDQIQFLSQLIWTESKGSAPTQLLIHALCPDPSEAQAQPSEITTYFQPPPTAEVSAACNNRPHVGEEKITDPAAMGILISEPTEMEVAPGRGPLNFSKLLTFILHPAVNFARVFDDQGIPILEKPVLGEEVSGEACEGHPFDWTMCKGLDCPQYYYHVHCDPNDIATLSDGSQAPQSYFYRRPAACPGAEPSPPPPSSPRIDPGPSPSPTFIDPGPHPSPSPSPRIDPVICQCNNPPPSVDGGLQYCKVNAATLNITTFPTTLSTIPDIDLNHPGMGVFRITSSTGEVVDANGLPIRERPESSEPRNSDFSLFPEYWVLGIQRQSSTGTSWDVYHIFCDPAQTSPCKSYVYRSASSCQ